MPKLTNSRSAQYPLVSEFNFSFANWVIDSADGAKKTLGASVANSTDPSEPLLNGPVANTVVFDAFNMPLGAVLTGGEVIVETAFVGPTAATLSLGVVGALTGLAATVDLKTLGSTALTATGVAKLLANSGQNLRATIAYTAANATAGKVRVRVTYTIDGRAHEAVTS